MIHPRIITVRDNKRDIKGYLTNHLYTKCSLMRKFNYYYFGLINQKFNQVFQYWVRLWFRCNQGAAAAENSLFNPIKVEGFIIDLLTQTKCVFLNPSLLMLVSIWLIYIHIFISTYIIAKVLLPLHKINKVILVWPNRKGNFALLKVNEFS